jgi:hypothetical protein
LIDVCHKVIACLLRSITSLTSYCTSRIPIVAGKLSGRWPLPVH